MADIPSAGYKQIKYTPGTHKKICLESMKKIGLSGGIGSGKSTVAKLLEKRGFVVIDADKVARDIVAPGQPALEELAAEFGEDVLASDGSLNRQALAERAFASPERTAALNAITHPRVAEETARRFAAAEAAGAAFAVYDVPLLVDNGIHRDMDATIIVDVDPEVRVRRLVEFRGLSEDDARRRIASQISDEERLAVADYVIDNNGDVAALGPQVDEFVAKFCQ